MQATAQQLASLPSGELARLISQMWLEEMYTANDRHCDDATKATPIDTNLHIWQALAASLFVMSNLVLQLMMLEVQMDIVAGQTLHFQVAPNGTMAPGYRGFQPLPHQSETDLLGLERSAAWLHVGILTESSCPVRLTHRKAAACYHASCA